jgi:DNA-binding MarR family transcriptional regulator
MEKLTESVSNYELWLLMGKIHHDVVLVRQKELSPYHIPPQQLNVLRTIQYLGEKATLSNIAKELERKPNVISRQAAGMEKDGLLKRTNDTPKSRLLKIELTEKGRDMLNIRDESKIIDAAWSFLNEEDRQKMYSVLYRMSTKLKEQDPI